ncbi:3'(2'),5'-bisphosphate nucleotidase CysQ [Porticoccus sp.]
MARPETGRVDFALLEQIVALAESAGSAIMSFYKDIQKVGTKIKEDRSPVTEADVAANQILLSRLPGLLNVPILSEESAIPSYAVRAGWGRYWLVDPLDGTREFLSGNGEFTVNIALIEDHRPVLGVVYAPAAGIGYAGVRGAGAYRYAGGRAAPICTRTMAAREADGVPLTLVASRRHGSGEVVRLQQRLSQRFGDVVVRQIGSSLKLCRIAEGVADLYPHFWPTSEWDTAAGQAVVEAAGGRVLTMDRCPLLYNREDSVLNPFFYAVADSQYEWGAILPSALQELE